MGHGKNKKQNVGMGQEKKESRLERRLRLEEEANAREECFQILPYVLGGVVFIILVFALYVHSVPAKGTEILVDDMAAGAAASGINVDIQEPLSNVGPDGVADPIIDLDGGSL